MMSDERTPAAAENRCPGCGAGFSAKPHKYLGWVFAECERRWHVEHGWEPMPPASCLYRQLDAANARIAKLEAIVAKLPKTEDGVPVVAGDGPFWAIVWGRILETDKCKWESSTHGDPHLIARTGYRDKGGGWHDSWPAIEDCYSTREAAEAAKGVMDNDRREEM